MRILFAIFIYLCSLFSASCQTSKTDERLKKALERFPESDKDRDGVLTLAEAKLFRNSLKSGKKKKKSKPNIDGDLYSRELHNVRYGDHERNVIDLLLAKSDKPTPLVIFIHGGGFKGGDKSKGYRHAKDFLEKGISFASINYRLLQHVDNGVTGCLNDSKRALQFLRYKASEFNLDKTKFACMGGSAGAGTTFWLAFSDDMANPDSEDPVERESTRISAAIGFGAQATYDIERWYEIMDVKGEGDRESLLSFYGFENEVQMQTKEGRSIIDNLDMLDLLTKDDPPFYVMNGHAGGEVDVNNKGHLYHHANHARALKDRAMKVGVEHLCFAPKIGIKDSEDSNIVNFVLKQF